MEELDVMEHVLRLARVMKRRSRKEKIHSHSQRRVMHYLMKHPGERSTDLAKGLDIRPSSLTELLDGLEKQGYVVRKKDATDSRAILIYPSDKLAHKYQEQRKEQKRISDETAKIFSETEKEEFVKLCNKLYDSLTLEREGSDE